MTLRRAVRTFLWIAGTALIGIAVTIAVLIVRFQPIARDYIISALQQRYRSTVQLGNLQITLFPKVHATAENLTLRLQDRSVGPPMIVVRRITIDAQLPGFFRSPKRIDRVRLEGLQIHIPPRSGAAAQTSQTVVPFVLDEVIADGTMLETLPVDPNKDPLSFAIRQLTLHSVGPGRPMTFHAELENPKPPGFIHSDGNFGPWDQDEPGDTPIDGHYTFSGADLSVFKGIRGILSSTGDYRGHLNRIDVHGVTDVPAFSLTTGGRALPLHTEFDATVDGTNGDTDLHPVHALLGHSAFDVTGAIERHALEMHKEIDLEARTTAAGLEDFLRLSIAGGPPPMKGRIGFDTKVKIPPGDTPVIQRIQLAGTFTLHNVTFTNADVQAKIASLSHHAQGKPKDTDPDVAANFKGRFGLRNGVLGMPQLKFNVPGADIDLKGKYTLQSGDIDFEGTARLEARFSQMTTGIKRTLLRPLNPLFSRDGAGMVLPIKITGTRKSPSFHLELGKALKEDALH